MAKIWKKLLTVDYPRPLIENGNAQPAGSIFTLFMGTHKAVGDHSGNRPLGKKKKGERLRGVPGTGNGVCLKKIGKDAAECRCGGHHK